MDKSQFDAKLLMTYRELISIYEEQLQLAMTERYDSQIIDVQDLEERKFECLTLIEKVLRDINGYSSLSESSKDQLLNDINELQQLNEQLQLVINDWYSKDSTSMKKIRAQRTTLQAYGGANNADFVSYYIDDKK